MEARPGRVGLMHGIDNDCVIATFASELEALLQGPPLLSHPILPHPMVPDLMIEEHNII